ncbi:MAG: glycosyltransferase family 4 protein [Clostridiales bacterium]|nr:glycosyltransferase family 4 protein [Clostridiales bacterium]
MQKKVLIIGVNDVGLYNFRKEFMEELINSNFEVHFSVPYGSKVELLEELGAVYHRIELQRRGKNPANELKLIVAYYKLIKKTMPSLVVTQTIKPNIYASLVAKVLGIQYINLVTGLGSGLSGNNLSAKLIGKLYRVALSKSRCVFFQNEGDLQHFKEFLDRKEIKRVLTKGSGVNLEKYDKSQFFPDGDTTGSTTSFIFIGRIQKEKGIEEYIEAAVYYAEQNCDCDFSVLGFYDEEAYIEIIDRLAENGTIKYIGVSDDTRVEMSKSNCVVLPSYHEGMSNVLLEGAAMELPLITTNVHGCKEAVEDGVTGFLCEPKNAESLIVAIEKFLKLSAEERAKMGELGRQKMIKEFDRKTVVKQYMQAVNEILG